MIAVVIDRIAHEVKFTTRATLEQWTGFTRCDLRYIETWRPEDVTTTVGCLACIAVAAEELAE